MRKATDMTTVAVTMVRDEDDIIEHTVAHMLQQVDAVIVADNLSTDGTRAILDRLAVDWPHILIVDDYDPAYRQSEKMTALAHRARSEFGADWVVPFDADEWWYSPHFDRVGDALAEVPSDWWVAAASLYDHVATGRDPDVDNPIVRLGHRRLTEAPLPKVAARYGEDLVIEQGNHGATYTVRPGVLGPLLVVRHFPYRSLEQLLRKIRNGSAAYRAAGDTIPATFGAHWRQWGDLLEANGEDAIEELWRTWYWQPDGTGLIYDPAP